ncbi:MAG: sigma-54-dependent Fis family transcriptional regulator [FCB group bacterium]|nr:sigma-54-dependent Fis family transcriptional regulator [FCB group bacterium]MBL7027571.1 sigma-54-dependent Fis family transcriptional regulator [Candidatus Neomarinimicrobiota bacterium]MBL7121201.1 sigma-54-dependent Fis family transcriptional regulator [Candidatus Neomarinimicrobiota bacterium]
MLKILLVEDERINRITLQKLLEHAGYAVTAVEDGTAGLEAVQTESWDVVLTDYRLPGADGLEILEEVKRISPDTQVLIMTAFATVENALSALKKGAFDYLTKPFDPDELFHHLARISAIRALNSENKVLRASLAELKVSPDLIGQSEIMRDLFEKVKIVAESEHTVLIQGASGTGKEKIANAVQSLSQRRENPYVKINCSALSETLFETEMFGHEKGAFTGAVKRSIGRFERAKGGTILLDDIDDLSMRLQTKLLRVIQEGEIERVGGTEVIPVDVRIIAATKIDLKSLVEKKSFREDLYYRLNVIRLIVPALNERKSDIPLLAHFFLSKLNADKQLSPELIKYLMDLDWPGNVRELEHLIMQMSVFCRKTVIDLNDIPDSYLPIQRNMDTKNDGESSLTTQVNEFEMQIINDSMDKYSGNQQKVADSLGIPRTTLRSKLLKHGLIDLKD